jgi:uncharacterized membrane protein
MVLGLILHILGAVVWVGGMFFAYIVLRPAAGTMTGPERLRLWRGVFERFFPWVMASILALLVSGYWMLFGHFGGFGGAPVHVHIMNLTGLVMMALFLHLYFAPWQRMRRALDGGDTALAATQLNQIRMIVLVNLVLGLITVVVGSSGRFWG